MRQVDVGELEAQSRAGSPRRCHEASMVLGLGGALAMRLGLEMVDGVARGIAEGRVLAHGRRGKQLLRQSALRRRPLSRRQRRTADGSLRRSRVDADGGPGGHLSDGR